MHGSSKHSLFKTNLKTLGYKQHSQLVQKTVVCEAASFYAAVKIGNHFQPYDPSREAHQVLEIHYCHEYVKSFEMPVGYRQNLNFPNQIDHLFNVIVRIADGILHTAYPINYSRGLYIPHNSVQEWHITRNYFSHIAAVYPQKTVTAVQNSSEEELIQDNLEEKQQLSISQPEYSILQVPRTSHLA